MHDTPLVLGGKEFSSRLIVGTGKYPSMDIMRQALEESGALALGDAVSAFGYPEAGSTHGRTPIVHSRGVVSGFERIPGNPVWVKTDAWVGPGHSGGALVDAEGRLVGVPAATLGTVERLALAIPVPVIPEAWREEVRKALPAR